MLCAQLHSGEKAQVQISKTHSNRVFSLAVTDLTPDQDPAGGPHTSSPPGAAGSRGMLSALTNAVQNTVSTKLALFSLVAHFF